jgi:hypothetical protein
VPAVSPDLDQPEIAREEARRWPLVATRVAGMPLSLASGAVLAAARVSSSKTRFWLLSVLLACATRGAAPFRAITIGQFRIAASPRTSSRAARCLIISRTCRGGLSMSLGFCYRATPGTEGIGILQEPGRKNIKEGRRRSP